MSIANKCINGVCVCILPLPENNHRPLALRHSSLALFSAVLIMLKIMTISAVALTPAQAELSTITSQRIVQLTNNERVKSGRSALNVNPLLAKAAQEKGQHMLQEEYFAHISPSGVTPWFWINKNGYSYTIAGENLAIDFSRAEDVVAGWLGSPSHKENMLHPEYTETGVAVVTGKFQGSTSTIVVHMFGKPVTQAPLLNQQAITTTEPSMNNKPTPSAPNNTAPVPHTPTLTLESNSQTRDTVILKITGDPKSSVQLVINDQKKNILVIPENGSLTYTHDISDFKDGLLEFKAYALNEANQQSGFSEKIEITKHTTGPNVTKEDIVMILSPGTDRPRIAMNVLSDSYSFLALPDKNPIVASGHIWLSMSQITPEPINLVFSDDIGNNTEIALNPTPAFALEDTDQFKQPARFTSLARTISLAIFISLATLLMLAIFIRINIQHPGLILHSILVIILASIILLF